MDPEIAAIAAPPTFAVRLSSTPRGARRARRLAAHQLDCWGIAHETRTARTVAAVTAELAANAVRHGAVPGRDFELRLILRPGAVRIEVSDTRTDRLPSIRRPGGESECGRGLLLVDALADDWGCRPRDAYVKTVWAVVRR